MRSWRTTDDYLRRDNLRLTLVLSALNLKKMLGNWMKNPEEDYEDIRLSPND